MVNNAMIKDEEKRNGTEKEYLLDYCVIDT
jgi:hypothetical protein